MYINIHSHDLKKHNEKLVFIPSLNDEIPCHGLDYFFYGIHPWEKEFDLSLFEERLITFIKDDRFLGLGEIGLDRVHKNDFEKQTALFKEMITLAQKYNINRLQLHSVKAHQDIFDCLKTMKYKGKLLFHDFNANKQTATMFSEHFDSYFSFGHRLFNSGSKANKTFQEISLNQILLETDDQVKHSIENIYAKASELISIDIEVLKERLHRNFNSFSGN